MIIQGMQRDGDFKISRKPYAIGLDSLKIGDHGYATMEAAWFRRRNSITVACLGQLWDIHPDARNAADFLEVIDTGRYGGTALSRWDGHGYWGHEDPEQMVRDLEILRPMLSGFPAVPDGYDGWWSFRR